MAIKRLVSHGLKVKAIGLREGIVDGVVIEKGLPQFQDIDTILLYINPRRQAEFFVYLLSLKPRRVIFNPGTENPELEKVLIQNKIETIEACSLVMLASGQY